jgi:hypothetical protein
MLAIIDALLEQLLISTKGERTPKKKEKRSFNNPLQGRKYET